ncbi:hypothetical protein HMPREF0673_02546 [Leyella stercorea DSM 18206]|uniref:Uncharacterized protein n=1 Tax=Leyella stercorea DSM 18206 TaxID=1002367 RepID=G6B0X8_9BACT|nr:hypothetical protein HMPREF0673_02546 [Leyella stercorea DSM 18206]
MTGIFVLFLFCSRPIYSSCFYSATKVLIFIRVAIVLPKNISFRLVIY